jgi:hypothetical protein
MKKILSLILACLLIFSCGGVGQEPPLKDGKTDKEVPIDGQKKDAEVSIERQKKTDKTSKTGMIVLGVVLAVSLLVNFGLGWRLLWVKTRKITDRETEAAMDVLENSHPEEAFLVRLELNANRTEINDLRTRLEILQLRIDNREESIRNLNEWVVYFKRCAQAILASKENEMISPPFRYRLQQIIDKDVNDFENERAPNSFFTV